MSGYLLLGVCQGVERLVYFLPNDLILDTHYSCEEHIVLRLGFDADIKLLNTWG